MNGELFTAFEKLKSPQNQKLSLKLSYNRDGWLFIWKIVKGKKSIIIPWVNAVEQKRLVFSNEYAYMSTDSANWIHGIINSSLHLLVGTVLSTPASREEVTCFPLGRKWNYKTYRIPFLFFYSFFSLNAIIIFMYVSSAELLN